MLQDPFPPIPDVDTREHPARPGKTARHYWPEIWGDICDKYARKAGSWLFENEPHLQEATFRGFAARQFSPDFAAAAWSEYTAG